MFDVGGSRDFTSSDFRVRKWTLWDKRFNVKGRKYHILEHFACMYFLATFFKQLKGSCKNLKFENSNKCKNFHKRENNLR